jgi:hypothetical protein
MSALTKKEWMEYIEKTWDVAQKEAWSEPQFEPALPKRKWVGLTLKEVLTHRHLIDWTSEWSYLEFAREIERALKEKNT